MPGIPFTVIGRNEDVAWGITMSIIENMDLYEIKLDETKKHYYHNNTWKPLKIVKEVIKVSGGEDVTYEIYNTHHGPIIDYPLAPEIGSLFA